MLAQEQQHGFMKVCSALYKPLIFNQNLIEKSLQTDVIYTYMPKAFDSMNK